MNYLHIESAKGLVLDDYWEKLLKFFYPKMDLVTFNILYKDEEYNRIVKTLSDSLIKSGINKQKLYPSGPLVNFEPTDNVKTFLFSKKYSDWKNYCLEDMSFWKGDIEIMATITHEDYIFLIDSKENRTLLEELHIIYRNFDFSKK